MPFKRWPVKNSVKNRLALIWFEKKLFYFPFPRRVLINGRRYLLLSPMNFWWSIIFVFALLRFPKEKEAELVRAIKKGDKHAFRQLFEHYNKGLFRFLVSRGVDSDEAEDIVQQSFVSLWEKRTALDENKSLHSFLFTICLNRAKNVFRFQEKMERLEFIPERGEEPAEADQSKKELFKTFDTAIADMPEKRRAVFELCFVEGLTYRESAEVLGVSIKTIENHMGLALKSVRTALKKFL